MISSLLNPLNAAACSGQSPKDNRAGLQAMPVEILQKIAGELCTSDQLSLRSTSRWFRECTTPILGLNASGKGPIWDALVSRVSCKVIKHSERYLGQDGAFLWPFIRDSIHRRLRPDLPSSLGNALTHRARSAALAAPVGTDLASWHTAMSPFLNEVTHLDFIFVDTGHYGPENTQAMRRDLRQAATLTGWHTLCSLTAPYDAVISFRELKRAPIAFEEILGISLSSRAAWQLCALENATIHRWSSCENSSHKRYASSPYSNIELSLQKFLSSPNLLSFNLIFHATSLTNDSKDAPIIDALSQYFKGRCRQLALTINVLPSQPPIAIFDGFYNLFSSLLSPCNHDRSITRIEAIKANNPFLKNLTFACNPQGRSLSQIVDLSEGVLATQIKQMQNILPIVVGTWNKQEEIWLAPKKISPRGNGVDVSTIFAQRKFSNELRRLPIVAATDASSLYRHWSCKGPRKPRPRKTYQTTGPASLALNCSTSSSSVWM